MATWRFWLSGRGLGGGSDVGCVGAQQTTRPASLLDTFSGAHLYLREYFMETALQQQPTAVQNFLLQTSILKQLTGGLCDVVTGQTDGAQMLARLWQENLFMVRSEEPDYYHYHDLFAEMLHDQLQGRFPPSFPTFTAGRQPGIFGKMPWPRPCAICWRLKIGKRPLP